MVAFHIQTESKAKASRKPRFSDNCGGRSEGGQPEKKGRGKGATGRRPSGDKPALVSATEQVYPEGVSPSDCMVVRTQCAWHLVAGRTVYIRYEIFDHPDSVHALLLGGLRTSRSELGLEIVLMVAFLHYWIGVSLAHACQIIAFFTGLELSKSQAHALLDQLSEDWQQQEETLAQLMALQ